MKRYLEQAERDYEGKPNATATVVDDCHETIVLVRMQRDDDSTYVLAWIGAEYAESPDEFDNELPDGWCPKWCRLKK